MNNNSQQIEIRNGNTLTNGEGTGGDLPENKSGHTDEPNVFVFTSSRNSRSYRYYFDLILNLVKRDFTLRYKGSLFGILWILVVPLMQLLTLVFVFKRVIPLDIEGYPAFVFTALLPWTWFSQSLNSAGAGFIGNKDLVRHPNFSPIILIIVNTLTNLLLYLTVLPLMFVMLLAYGHRLGWPVLYFPVFLLLESILIVGLSLVIATWNVFYRDIQQITSMLLSILFWLTPVFYRSHTVDQEYQFLFDVNPMAVLIQGYRDILFYSQPPDWTGLVRAAVVSLAIGILGYAVYRRQLHNVFDAL